MILFWTTSNFYMDYTFDLCPGASHFLFNHSMKKLFEYEREDERGMGLLEQNLHVRFV